MKDLSMYAFFLLSFNDLPLKPKCFETIPTKTTYPSYLVTKKSTKSLNKANGNKMTKKASLNCDYIIPPTKKKKK